MKLNEIERQSAIWLKISGYLKDRLDTLRVQNDGDRDISETARIRGQIKEIKIMLDIGIPDSPAIIEQ